MTPFSDPEAVARYTEGPVRMVPGFAGMQRMTEILLAERCGAQAEILVLGAGGGLELRVFAQSHPDWRFVGVDPSAEMLALATQTMGPLAEQARLYHGYIDSAPAGPFDGATCLLTLHFLPREDRLATLIEIRRRLKPGAPLVVAHHSFARGDESAVWLARFAAFGAASGIDPELAQRGAKGIGAALPVLSPADDEAVLRAAGFADISLFYAAFTFRGWICYAP